MGEIITDEMVALEYQRLSGCSFEIAEQFASELRGRALTGGVDYTQSFPMFVDLHIKTAARNRQKRKLGKQKNTVRLNRWEPMVATPAYDDKVDSCFAHALGESSYACPLFQVHLTFTIMKGGAFIDLTRNILTRMFLQDEPFQSCTHLFFIDSDLKWSPNAFVGLVRSDLPICAGVYPKRQSPIEYPIKFSEHPIEGGLWVEEEEDGFQWIMADRVPTGFLCIRRDVVEEMAKDSEQLDIHGQPGPVPYLFGTELLDSPDVRWPGSKKYVGEDYSFCDRYVEKYNKRIHVWPDIDFVHGGYEGNLLSYLKEKIEGDELIGAEVPENVEGVGIDG